MKERLTQTLEQLKAKYPAVAFVSEVIAVFLDRRVTRAAAELAYYLLMAVFPLLIMVVAILGWLPLDEAEVTKFLMTLIPSQTFEMLSSYVSYVLSHKSTSLFAAGLIMSITVSSSAFRSLLNISSEIYLQSTFKGIWFTVISFVLSLLLLVVVYASQLVVLTGKWFFNWFKSFFHMIPLPDNILWIRLLILLGIALLFLVLLYRITAPLGDNPPRVLVGAIITAVLLVSASDLFSIFMGLSTKYATVYGSLASIIILMLWLFLCGNIVILGNVFNYVLWRRKQGLPVGYLQDQKF